MYFTFHVQQIDLEIKMSLNAPTNVSEKNKNCSIIHTSHLIKDYKAHRDMESSLREHHYHII